MHLNFWIVESTNSNNSVEMGRHHPGGGTGPGWKAVVLIFDVQIFPKQNETSFIRDQYCHLADDGSPILISNTSSQSLFSYTFD